MLVSARLRLIPDVIRVLRHAETSSHESLFKLYAVGCRTSRYSNIANDDKRFYRRNDIVDSEGNVDGLKNLKRRLNGDKNVDVSLRKRYFGVASTIVNRSSVSLQPYMKLMRIDKPIGSWLLFWPCGWSIALAAPAGAIVDVQTLALFGLGAFVMRGAGCTINDMWDKDIDGKVARTRDRPLVSGQVTQLEALIFLSGQLGVGLLILLQLNWYSIVLGASSLGLVVVYPLMKRVTYWPQLILGMTFNWGALLGWSAVHGTCNWSVCLPLYAAGVCWTILYDTIYAHQDKVDDILLGIKSTALKFGDNTKLWLSCFGTTMIANLMVCGIMVEQEWPYYVTVGLIGTHLANQIYTLNIDNPADCAKKFSSNHRVGLVLFSGILLGNLIKSRKNNSEMIKNDEEESATKKVIDETGTSVS